ncbi:hypothetical protein BH24DEI2_BH24DEI2_07320 [soil metagenome]
MIELKVPRTTATYADVLVALGLAELVKKENVIATIRESPDAFTLELPQTPTFDTKRLPYRYIRTKDDSGKHPNEIDYLSLKSAWETHFEFLRQAKGDKEALENHESPIEFDNRTLITSLVDLLKPIEGSAYDKTFELIAWLTDEQYKAFASLLMTYFSTHNAAAFEKDWKALAKKEGLKEKESSVQVFNPMMGKGMNAAKANSISMSPVKEWLPIEALKFMGWWVGVIASTPRKSKDRKVLCAVPADIAYDRFLDVMGELRASFRGGGSIQIDVRAALNLARILLKFHPQRAGDFWSPKQAVSGLYSVYFLNLGSAKGVSNLSLISLPSWVVLDLSNIDEEVQAWSEILFDHLIIVGRLDESRTDQYNLLLDYRNFMSGGSLNALLEFLIAYGIFALAKTDREKTPRAARWFSPVGLRKVMLNMDETLSDILENQGFQNVAAAIRRATRGAVYAKLNGNKNYPVHYGLAQELKRKAFRKPDFVRALSDFVAEYNNENLRVAERFGRPYQKLTEVERKKLRTTISDEDFSNVVRLLDTFDSETGAKTLIAYGYTKSASEPANHPDSNDLEPTEELSEEVDE